MAWSIQTDDQNAIPPIVDGTTTGLTHFYLPQGQKIRFRPHQSKQVNSNWVNSVMTPNYAFHTFQSADNQKVGLQATTQILGYVGSQIKTHLRNMTQHIIQIEGGHNIFNTLYTSLSYDTPDITPANSKRKKTQNTVKNDLSAKKVKIF